MANDTEHPPVAIGHVTLRVTEIPRSCRFFEILGLRRILEKEGMAIFELRGGTHLLLFRAKRKPRAGPVRSFDFMVNDVSATRDGLIDKGLEPGPIEHDDLGGHDYFQISDPDGHILGVYSSHVDDRPV